MGVNSVDQQRSAFEVALIVEGFELLGRHLVEMLLDDVFVASAEEKAVDHALLGVECIVDRFRLRSGGGGGGG